MKLESLSKEELSARLRTMLDAEKQQHIRLGETARLMSELQVHQLELEMQNRELLEAQHALEESWQRHADLYDFAPVAYFTFDARGTVTEVNLAGAAIVDRDRARVVGRPFGALVDLGDPSALWGNLRRCVEERRPVVTELLFSTARGRLETQMVSAPVIDRAGTVVGFRIALVDISERNEALRERQRALQAEQILHAQLNELDRANAALVDALSSTRSSTAVVLPIIVRRARALVGAEFAALGLAKGPGEPFDPFLYDGIDERVRERLGRTPRAVGVFAILLRERRSVRLKDLRESPEHRGFPAGHPPMSSFLGMPIALGEHTIGSLYVANKIGGGEFTNGDQRTLERFATRAAVACEIARLQQQARDAVQSRDLALAIVSHDLRNPVSAILLNATAFERESPEADRTRARGRIESIKRSAQHMNRLIEDLLTAATIESGTLSARFAPTSVREILEEAADMIRPRLAARSQQLEVRVAEDLPDACCDRARMVQVLGNLVSNAVKFSPEGQTVEIDARLEQGEILVSVTDAGPGIPPDELEHVFERYWKAQPRRGAGAGLGLYISRGIVAAHGGRIWARSEVGHGCTFSFTIPTCTPPAESPR